MEYRSKRLTGHCKMMQIMYQFIWNWQCKHGKTQTQRETPEQLRHEKGQNYYCVVGRGKIFGVMFGTVALCSF
jgi:hypothetical protein